ncbi:MAG: hypothetical protein HQK81_04830 [Desulfovibrionaceae bacterium]|nr:hypothetical protein [Desulfovibrionaceae bacterium]MBF0513370.1 hypothetical protein [Desulfovibrionaceae bacterium]
MSKHFSWQDAFSRAPGARETEPGKLAAPPQIKTIRGLKNFLDQAHIKHCLLKPYFTTENYPLVESRELLPSFEGDLYEYKDLPGFSMVALARPLKYFQEVFQYDILHGLYDQPEEIALAKCPLEDSVFAQNALTVAMRLPRQIQEEFRARFAGRDVTSLDAFPDLLDYLGNMERAHVMAQDTYGDFYLSGVYASLPSDLDTELKRFGLRIGKFTPGDDKRYERNRQFVYQFLMELYGFPIVSERRTSAALFARRLHRLGENFLVRVLGQSDRTVTSLYSHPDAKDYPRLEKLALVSVGEHQKEALNLIGKGGYFVDPQKRVVILRVIYRQHKFDPNNVRQDRALSVLRQEVVHPLTGFPLAKINIIKDIYNLFLRLNDIVRGEYTGRIIFKRNEIVENTDTDEKRLKFLYAWLTKNQRRIIGYSDEFYSNVAKVLDSYLLSPDNYDSFDALRTLHQEVWGRYSFIQQARRVKDLEDLQLRHYKGAKLTYLQMLTTFSDSLGNLKYEIVNYFDNLVERVLNIGETILCDRYLLANYVHIKDEKLSPYGLSVKKNYGRVVKLLDEIKQIRKLRQNPHTPPAGLFF